MADSVASKEDVMGKKNSFFEIAAICGVFKSAKERTVGTKITDRAGFEAHLVKCLKNHDPANDRVSGQHFIVLPEEAYRYVSPGDGPRTNNPEDYVPREHRGRVELYLKRHKAGKVNSLAVVVYTTQAYLADPEVAGDEAEVARIKASGASHVIVAVLASSGPRAPLTPYRLVSNLAGGNNEALEWDADEIRTKARESLDYWDHWCVVAD